MKKIIFIVLLLLLFVKSFGIELARDGRSEYLLVMADNPTLSEDFAAKEFANLFEQVTGSVLERGSASNVNRNPRAIYIGHSYDQIDESTLDEFSATDAFVIFTEKNNLYISGGKRGIIYGVYEFFEAYAGCRWFATDCIKIPQIKNFTIPEISNFQRPAFDWRELYNYPACDPETALIWRLNRNTYNKIEGGYSRNVPSWLGFVHTAFRYLPPEEWQDSNPEFYSRRHKDRRKLQICYSRKETIPIVVENIKKHLSEHSKKENPTLPFWADKDVLYIDFSQMDCEYWCICPECLKGYIKYGSKMGPILEYVNEIASFFPDYTVTTLSYWYSVKPPQNIKPADNVRIVLCNIKNYRSRPLTASHYLKDRQFIRYLEEWSSLSDNIFIWDYTINFNHYLMPFPNLAEVQQGNIRLFRDNNVKGVFSQGTNTAGSSFAQMRAYIISKLLWNPDCDAVSLEKEFIDNYYGEASEYVQEYVDLIKKKSYNDKLWIYNPPSLYMLGYLSASNVKRYREILNQGLHVTSEAIYRERVKELLASLAYVTLYNNYFSKKSRESDLELLEWAVDKYQIKWFGEVDYPTEKFFAKYR
ncbi:MAG: DUF4838 domain-containing protein [Spirochaetales bacterium]|nr:DUF4838 domain-containing protein [Spirochaetales bacterium]